MQREEGAVGGEIQEADGARSCRAWKVRGTSLNGILVVIFKITERFWTGV